MLPARLLFCKLKPVTLPLVQLTPNQSQGSTSVSQPVLSVQLAPVVLVYKATRASHSNSGINAWLKQSLNTGTGVFVAVGVCNAVGVLVGVFVAAGVSDGVLVGVSVGVGVGVLASLSPE